VAALDDNTQRQLQALGDFIKAQRKLAELSLRELAARTNVSNPYLSQIERGLHEPSVRVLKAIAGALNMSAETLLKQAGLLEEEEKGVVSETAPTTEKAIAADQALTAEQRTAMLAVYRSYVEANGAQGAKKPRA
jgi:transcriptional regulator with XRE-family HTH domain